jgi:peptide/nickel transport system substrate-binding protein
MVRLSDRRPFGAAVNRRRLLGGVVLGGASAAFLAACGGGDDGAGDRPAGGATTGAGAGTAAVKEQPVKGGTLTKAIGGDPPNLDMHANSTYLVNHAVAPIYNQLVQFDPGVVEEGPGSIVADLAKSWEQAGDGLTYTFKLNEGVTFHDGKPFGSADVKASLERISNPPRGIPSPRQDQMGAIDRIETPDGSTVVLKLKQPAPSLLPILAQGWMSIYSAQDIGADFDFKLKTNGTGPFKLKEYLRGNRVMLEANDAYFVKEQPYLRGITIFVQTDAGARLSAFQAGEVSFSTLFTVTDLKSLESALRDRLVVQKRDGYGFETINFGQRPPWRDERVRRAVSMAMDRKAAITLLQEGDGTVGGYLSPGGPWTLTQDEIQALPGYAPVSDKTYAEAKALLSAAGVREGHEATLLTRRNQSSERASLFIRDMLLKIGIDAKPQVLEDAAAYDALNNRNFDMAPWGHAYALDDPDAVFAEFYLPDAPRNYSEVSSPELADLFAKQTVMLDQQERVKLVKEMQKKAIPLYSKVIISWSLRRWAWWNKVNGYTAHVGYYNNNRHAETWLKG